MKGVLLGLIEDDAGVPHVGIGLNNSPLAILSIEYATTLFDQLGTILDAVGAFDEPEVAAPEIGVPPRRRQH